MQTCPECGNHDMRLLRSDRGPVHECGLCGARFGERAAIEDLDRIDEAEARGIDADIWPLFRVLERLPGLQGGPSSGGSARSMPKVELLVVGPQALGQIENVAKSLRLEPLRCTWRIEVTFEMTLQFVVGAVEGSGSLRDAQLDVEDLAAAIARNSRLGWWRHANGEPTG